MIDWLDEEGARRIIADCTTTPEVGDPTKPFMTAGEGMITPNPKFDRAAADAAERERQFKRPLGTSFVTFFHPGGNLHQISGEGDNLKREILLQTRERLVEALAQVLTPELGGGSFPKDQFRNALHCSLCPNPQVGFNNGEVYHWLKGMQIKKDLVLQILGAWSTKIEEQPVTVEWEFETYEVALYGFGWRYY